MQNKYCNLALVLPNKELVQQFKVNASEVEKKQQSNLKQNQELAKLRDWLLPMLMNGQLRVEDVADEVLGMVAESEESYRSSASIKN